MPRHASLTALVRALFMEETPRYLASLAASYESHFDPAAVRRLAVSDLEG